MPDDDQITPQKGDSDVPLPVLGQKYIIKVEKLTHGGAGLAHINEIPVFIPGSLPGQEVEITLEKHKGSYAEGHVEKVLKKSFDEVASRCSHCHDCGGCAWQNLPYNKQIEYKEEIVREVKKVLDKKYF